jgi:anti-sigma-K factor RskA
MAEHEIHELTAAYALDALDEVEELEFEEHLRTCASCREELRELLEAATALAYAVEVPAPPATLRARILSQARAERDKVVPLRPRRSWPTYVAGAVAAAAAAVAVGLGIWANSLSNSLDRQRATGQVLSDPNARRVALTGASGRLVLASTGDAALVVSGLQRAPSGRTYQVWVIRGDQPSSAGLFEGGEGRDVVVLTQRVPAGAVVAVTLEQAGGADLPTSTPLFSANT